MSVLDNPDSAEDSASSAPAVLPPRLESILGKLIEPFYDSQGRLRSQISDSGLGQAIATANVACSQLYDESLKNCCARLAAALGKFNDARAAHTYAAAQPLVEAALALLTQARALIPQTYMHDLRLLEEAIGGAEKLVRAHWRGFIAELKPRPRFVTGSTPTRLILDRTGEAEIPLRIALQADNAPVTQVAILLDANERLSPLAAPPVLTELAAGRTETVRFAAVLHQGFDGHNAELRLRAQLEYMSPSGEKVRSPMQNLLFTVVPQDVFEEIDNPYKPYAGGTTVADPKMFFGRASLLEQVLRDLSQGPPGQGLAIYGQKRSGKTSLVEQIRARGDRPPSIVLSISLGILDTDNLTSSFARAVLEQARVALLSKLDGADYASVSRYWPSDEKIEARPLQSLLSALAAGRAALSRKPEWAGLRYVLLVDEFTYLFELIRSGAPGGDGPRSDVREFLRQWKALLESRAFTSVVVGQDTMPYFMAHFPNEFSTMRPIRLSYLSPVETHGLADVPVRKSDESSRYTGYGLETIFHYTAGHPYFTQVLCDRIVDIANDKGRGDISEMDVEEAAESLISGPNRLQPYRFDCLLTADNSGLVAVTDGGDRIDLQDPGADATYSVLARLADAAGSGDRRVDRAQIVEGELDQQILDDLLMREVVEDSGGLKIRVYLFAEYLRRLTQ